MKRLIFSLAISLAVSQMPEPEKQKQFRTQDKYTSELVYDAVEQIYYVSSARTGAVGKCMPNGSYEMLYSDDNLKTTSALKMTPDGKRLFFCIGEKNDNSDLAENQGETVRLISIDATTGKKLTDTNLSALYKGDHFASDLTFDGNGNVFIADSYANVIYKVTPKGKASLHLNSKQFKAQDAGLTSIVWHPDGYLLVDSSGSIFKVGTKKSATVERVNTPKFFTESDGLVLNSKNVLTINQKNESNTIYQIESSDNWKSATVKAALLGDDYLMPSKAQLSAIAFGM